MIVLKIINILNEGIRLSYNFEDTIIILREILFYLSFKMLIAFAKSTDQNPLRLMHIVAF